jgi:hypothetical protein
LGGRTSPPAKRGNDRIYGKSGSDTDLDGNRGNDTIGGVPAGMRPRVAPGPDLCIEVEVRASCRLRG